MGLNLSDVARTYTDATSSSRFTEKNQWLDQKAAYTYQVQVQVPEYIMNEMNQTQIYSPCKRIATPCIVGRCHLLDGYCARRIRPLWTKKFLNSERQHS